jgi:pyruvate/2-oxoglutarate dehydrogenase complex dihydrolipoamide acyltransferase (E2) component
MKRAFLGLLTVLFFFELTGCASFLGSSKKLDISSDPDGAVIAIYDKNGDRINEAVAPSVISLNKAADYTIEASKTDYTAGKTAVKRKFNRTFWINFLISGIGLGYSLGVDPLRKTEPLNVYALAGYGLGAAGLIGAAYDLFTGSLTGVTPNKINFSLKMTPEALAAQEARELAAKEAQEKAEMEKRQAIAAEEEARRIAREEADRYDPSRFALVPDNFKPSGYQEADLFEAAAAARDLSVAANELEARTQSVYSSLLLGLGPRYIAGFVSEVTFVRQSGTNIEFTSDDKAISQTMTIDARSGLQAGQKVRVYYEIMRTPLTRWQIVAIERR